MDLHLDKIKWCVITFSVYSFSSTGFELCYTCSFVLFRSNGCGVNVMSKLNGYESESALLSMCNGAKLYR